MVFDKMIDMYNNTIIKIDLESKIKATLKYEGGLLSGWGHTNLFGSIMNAF